MSINTYVNVKRGTPLSTVYTGLPVQIDAASLDEIGYTGGEGTADAFMIYVKMGNPSLQRNDQITDVLNGGNPYIIINKPESFSDGHVEIKAYQPVGS